MARTPQPNLRSALRPGAVLVDAFRVERVVGVGGMGMVLAARDLALDRVVALKVMLPDVARDAAVTARFLREARAAARLRSEHITRVLAAGTLETGEPYLVMELLEGVDVATLLHTSGPLDVATAAALVWQAGDAVAEAHAGGIVHRDLKPANLFVARRRDGLPVIKVLDFGVCRVTAPDDLVATSALTVVGTPSYMAPEQLRSSQSTGPRSDIWSLGVVLHELVTGAVPFRASSFAELCVRISLDPYTPPDGVAPGFAAVVARCLEKDPERRFPSVEALRAALEPYAGALRLPTTSVEVGHAVPATEHATAPEVPPGAVARSRRTRLLGVAALLAAGAAVAVLGTSASPSPAPTTLAPTRGPAATTPSPPRAPAATTPLPAVLPMILPAIAAPVAPEARPAPRRHARPRPVERAAERPDPTRANFDPLAGPD